MRKITSEIRRNYIIFSICLIFMVSFNIIQALNYINNYKTYLDEYRTINNIIVSYDDSKSYFLLYSRNHDEESRVEFERAGANIFKILDELGKNVGNDKNCLMMYRIVYQMLEHRQELLQEYIQYGRISINDIEELNFQIERNMSLLTTGYLDYTSDTFDIYSKKIKTRILLGNGCLAILAATSFLLNSIINRNFLQGIEKLTNSSLEISNQHFDTEDIEDCRYEEINFVNHTFNNMKHRIREMIEEIKRNHEIKEKLNEQLLENEKQKRRLAEAQMRELQMQINPHFLFNTLSLIIRSIQIGEYDTSIQLIKSTSQILRKSIEVKDELILLDDELDLLEQYLYIQRIHCKGRIQIEMDVKKSYMDKEVKIPPLTLQPLVENAISHGLKNVVKDGKVTINITETANQILVSIKDNGCGIDKTIVHNIKEHIPMKRIGLSNVYERLLLIYHKEDVMEIDTSEEGTTVFLHLYKTIEG